MCARSSIQIMRSVPEQTAGIGRFVTVGVVDVNVHHMSCQRVGQIPPAPIGRKQELYQKAIQQIILIVVMRNDRPRAIIIRFLMIGPHVTEVAPTILVDNLTLSEKTTRSFEGFL